MQQRRGFTLKLTSAMFFLSSENASYGSVSCKFVGHNVIFYDVCDFIKFICALIIDEFLCSYYMLYSQENS